MIIIIHRINTIAALKEIPSKYGVEIDVRGYGDKLLLSHDPLTSDTGYDSLEDYLASYSHSFIVFNMKEAGYESRVIALAKKYHIENYFLLDVEFPYLYRASRTLGIRNMAVRYSEAEPIENVEAQIQNGLPLIDWVWIDTNTTLPLSEAVTNRLAPFRTCLVSPDRWGRPEDIASYIKQLATLQFPLTAVMTTLELAPLWEEYKI